jgi:hypothetical protein
MLSFRYIVSFFLPFFERDFRLKKKEANALPGEGTRLSVRAVKAAGLAFIEAKRRALTEEAGGSGAGFSQEGQRDEKGRQEEPILADALQKPRSCRAQELARSSAQENARRKREEAYQTQ